MSELIQSLWEKHPWKKQLICHKRQEIIIFAEHFMQVEMPSGIEDGPTKRSGVREGLSVIVPPKKEAAASNYPRTRMDPSTAQKRCTCSNADLAPVIRTLPGCGKSRSLGFSWLLSQTAT